jgi:hypothetical protein
MEGSQLNLRNGIRRQSRMRQNTCEPGAARATFSTPAQSTAKSCTPRACPGDVALLLDGVAVADAVSRGARRQRHLDLRDRGGVEAGAELGQQSQYLRGGVRLDGVEHPGVRQGLGEVLVVGAHDVEVDDEARAFVCAAFAALLKEFTDASHAPSAPATMAI